MASEETQKAKVYRLRGLPLHVDRQGVGDLLCSTLPSLDRNDITVTSLAPSCGFWTSDSKTATLTFSTPPPLVRDAPATTEWRLPAPGLQEPLILDHDFNGFTPLNHVPADQHEHEYFPRKSCRHGSSLHGAAASLFRALPAILWAHGNLEAKTNLSCGSATLSRL